MKRIELPNLHNIFGLKRAEDAGDKMAADKLQHDFKKGTMEAWGMPPDGRNLETYEKELLFNRNDLNGKTVLDLGAGPKVKLAKDLKEAGIDARVISYSPDFAEEKYSEKAKTNMPEAELIAGTGQDMPFENETFDNIFASHIFEHITQEQLVIIISEIARTLKPGGRSVLGPAWNIHSAFHDPKKPYELLMNNKQLEKLLKAQNVEVIKEMVPNANPYRYRYDGNSEATAVYEPIFNIVVSKHLK
jgi:ubiquinone/menaquinone biosynthesis C-methylase UbiE